MAGPVTQRRPTFLWQAALILLPVAVLAVMGWYSLRQDKILAEHDAKERAQAIADDLLPKIWSELTAKITNDSNPSFEVDDNGRLISPPPYEAVPTPAPPDTSLLNSNQARLWRAMQGSDAGLPDVEARVQNCKEFIASNPPENFAAIANYGLGVLLARQDKLSEAAQAFALVGEKYPGAVGESGLPLQPLAQWKLCELSEMATNPASNSINLFELYSNIVFHPTPLTPLFLERAGIEPASASGGNFKVDLDQRRWWQKAWAQQELARKLYLLAQSNFHFAADKSVPPLEMSEPGTRMTVTNLFHPTDSVRQSTPHVIWMKLPDHLLYSTSNAWLHEHSGTKGWFEERQECWLAVRRDENETNHWFVGVGEFEIGKWLTVIVENSKHIPDYFGIGIELAGRRIGAYAPDLRVWRYTYYMSKGAGQTKKGQLDELAKTVLASAAKLEGGTELLKVNVYLTSPDALYLRQRSRAFWFGALIIVSTIAALIGLMTAWRAFQRQLQLSEMKSNFVSSVSHELRAPIASVRLMAENLEGEKISEPRKQKEYFAFIVQECRRLSSLIENVLDFSRIEQGRKQYDFEPTDIGALVNQTVKLMEPNAVEKGVRLEIQSKLQTANSELTVDGRAIQQALVNLIDNAIKHSPKGEAVIVAIETTTDSKTTDSTERPASSHQYSILNLSVSDRGPGIPLDEQEKIFERFYRRGSELRRETVGVGIGLSIVKHIIEAHGGRVRVQSDVGKGSRFTIKLPMTKQNE